jgi:anion-transporting  ArsA/GET3 family ATPase
MAGTPPDLFDRSVLVVSGKGGVGKTTVAAACARAAGRRRARVLLAEIEGREGIARLLRVPAPGFMERPTRYGHSVLSITAKAALLEYLVLFFHMRTLSRSLRRAKVMDVATEAIPGFRDVMVAGKLYELTWWRAGRERTGDRQPYDLVVVDAPPTGQLLPFLKSSTAYRELIRAGRPHRQLESIDRLLREDARVALVAIPEEMSVAETIETVGALREANLPEPLIVVNQVTPPPFPKGVRAAALRMEPSDVVRVLKELDVETDEGAAEELLRAAHDTDARVREERRSIARLEKAAPVLQLPFLFTPSFGPDEIGTLAERFIA